MKRAHIAFFISIILLAACAPPSTPTPSSAPIATSVPATQAPLDLAGPAMTVGASYLYADGSLLVAVPAGAFQMGKQGGIDNPEHQVNLSDFWIYRNKVTNTQYAYCVAMGQCTPPALADDPGYNDPLHGADPIAGVDYDQASAYCGFVHARLPTEAEWEKAARGPDANIYPWGSAAPSCDLLNYESCVGNTTPVNKYPKGMSYYQAFDMEGNAFEWVSDWYDPNYYSVSPADDPQGPAKGDGHVNRSSAFNSGTDQTQAFNRFHSDPITQRNNLGFRCVVTDPTYFAPFCEYPPTYGTDGVGGPSDGTQVECTAPSITQDPTCKGNAPVTSVTFGEGNYSISDPTACKQDSTYAWTCTKNAALQDCRDTTVTVTGKPQCPGLYDYDPVTGKCELKGVPPPGQCLPGYSAGTLTLHRGPIILTNNTPSPTSSSPAQCCTYQPSGPVLTTDSGNEVRTLSPLPSCAPGTTFTGGQCVGTLDCYECTTASVNLNSCQSGGTCNLSARICAKFGGVCQYGGTFNAANCSCSCSRG
ncbi:MAG TPA: SUMF1/EgtB/PvdO family nonheme iron enzyme [Anaerolineales bacterium]|nr:SUMF1/EgtB/PvdO family nonheme iron enzyme [Anaerolineales bacterium]